MPAPLAAPACILAFVLPATLGLWLVHRSIHQRLRIGQVLIDNGVVGWFFSGIITIYGITLGLIAVSTWERTNAVANVASREAATLAALYRDAAGFPPPLSADLQARLRDYTRFVIDEAWPAQRRGETRTDGHRLLDDFQAHLYANEPATEAQKLLQAEALKTYNELIEHRRQRTEAVDQHIPGEIWVVILLGGALTIATSYCFQVEPFRLHQILTTILAATIGLLVFLIAALDRPYQGAVTVEPTAYQIVLDGAMTPNDK